MDPFCGCGTSLLEGLKLKRNVIGIDLSPIGILCSKVKTYKYEKKQIEKYADEILNVDEEKLLIPEFPNRELWFNKEVLKNLGMLNTVSSMGDKLEIFNNIKRAIEGK